MGQVLLVRHGQASWGADDYDVLSETGRRQAAAVGRALAEVKPDLVVHGAMRRQRDTARIAAEAAGWSAELREDARWDEMDHQALMDQVEPGFGGTPDRQQFQAWFERATERWTGGAHDGDYLESWPDFRTRVLAALADLAEAGTVVVVTSGGPVSAVVTDLLGAGVTTYARLSPVVVNSSVTRVVAGRRGLTLVSFNGHEHLDRELLTYR